MTSTCVFQPNWASPPGETIQDLLAEKKISIDEFASKVGFGIRFVESLLTGREKITAVLAGRLAETLGADSEFWLTREAQYREDVERIYKSISKEEKSWLNEIPVKSMQRLGWLPKESIHSKKLLHCLDFFKMECIDQWTDRQQNLQGDIRFRTSQTFDQSYGAVAAWLQQGEILAGEIECKPLNKDKLRDSIQFIRSLTNEKNPDVFIPKIKSVCAESGVAVVVAKTPEGCRASGATKRLSDSKSLLILSFRFRSDDHFWFTVFHEIAHLLLHDEDVVHIEGMGEENNVQEEEANAFSRDSLIPPGYRQELLNLKNDYRSVLKFSRKIGVSPGIIVGQMQYHNLIQQNHLNKLKVRYSWEEMFAIP